MSTATAITNERTIALVRSVEELWRVQRESANQLARDLGCARAALAALHALDQRGPLPLSEVAGLLRVDISVASRQVSHLVEAGYLERAIDDVDRRSRTIALTDAGRALVKRSYDHMTELALKTFANWSDDDLALAAQTIARVAASISDSHT